MPLCLLPNVIKLNTFTNRSCLHLLNNNNLYQIKWKINKKILKFTLDVWISWKHFPKILMPFSKLRHSSSLQLLIVFDGWKPPRRRRRSASSLLIEKCNKCKFNNYLWIWNHHHHYSHLLFPHCKRRNKACSSSLKCFPPCEIPFVPPLELSWENLYR